MDKNNISQYANYSCYKMYPWIMQFKSFHWLSDHGIGGIIPCSANMVSKHVIFGAFLFSV